MDEYKHLLIYVLGFIWILFASDYFAKFFRKTRIPLITGFLLTGIICGPHVLNFLEVEAIDNLGFINDIALAFIAFAAGAELYLKEIRNHVRSIAWNTFGQLIVTFIIGAIGVFILSDYIPFMKQMATGSKLAVAILVATIFVARSPSSAIAVISEMRAKGPFTQTVMGVTVIKDVLVIVLFAISLSLAMTIISGTTFKVAFIALLMLELAFAFGIGYLIGKLIAFILSFRIDFKLKTIVILGTGYAIFVFTHLVQSLSSEYIDQGFHIEPLLVAITASFFVTNYSRYRIDFRKILDETGPLVYVAFFTLVGAMLSIDILARVWIIALILFFVRLLAVIIGAYLGTILAKDPPLYKRIGWMPYVTQAGIGLGLATKVQGEFEIWGAEFATIVIAVIVLNQLVGPPLFKWAIQRAGEAHLRGEAPILESGRDTIIFGLEDQSLALARQLQNNDWRVKIASLKKREEVPDIPDIQLAFLSSLDLEAFNEIDASKADSIVLMLSDEENMTICDLLYEKIGTKAIIVRLNDWAYFNHFHQLGALIMHPSTAMVGLLDHLVRAPIATSLILGMEEEQDSEDFEVQDKQIHGMAIRNLELPGDVLILSVKRKKQVIVTHGYTRLRKKDIVTAIGSVESLDKLRTKFGK